ELWSAGVVREITRDVLGKPARQPGSYLLRPGGQRPQEEPSTSDRDRRGRPPASRGRGIAWAGTGLLGRVGRVGPIPEACYHRYVVRSVPTCSGRARRPFARAGYHWRYAAHAAPP